MKSLVLSLILISTVAAAQSKQKFTGTITDDMCPAGDHSRMRMGSNDAECALACASYHNALFRSLRRQNHLHLSDQKTPEKFAGKKVTVTGTLDAKTRTIHTDSISPAN